VRHGHPPWQTNLPLYYAPNNPSWGGALLGGGHVC
jgi:hypothetical protein